jgi:hypothetical protein
LFLACHHLELCLLIVFQNGSVVFKQDISLAILLGVLTTYNGEILSNVLLNASLMKINSSGLSLL